nr:hypothetical protein [Tessaracoccus sp. OS52]
MRRVLVNVIWAVGRRVPHWLRDSISVVGGLLLHRLPIGGLRQWDANFRSVMGRPPTMRERRGLVESWLRNNLMSLSLAHWSDEDVLSRGIISEHHLKRLRESLAGPGLVIALPHMGSWDFAGAWCARMGIKVVSVAERLPAGLYEKFRQAREGMGMDIYPAGEPGLMAKLAQDVRAGRMVCLLSDRDLSRRGIEVPWPTDDHPLVVSVPPGPALLAAQTGADLRAVVTIFRGDSVEMRVSERIDVESPRETMTDVVAAFAEGVDAAPTSWLMLQPLTRR